MKKSTPYLVAILVALIGFFVYSQGTAITPSPKQTQEISESKPSPQTENKIENYLQYTPELFSLHANKRRILFFYASWCETCVPTDTNFLEKSNLIPKDVVVFRVNYNDPDTDSAERELAKKYQITYQHTFVQIDKDGNVVTKWNGGELPQLLSKIK